MPDLSGVFSPITAEPARILTGVVEAAFMKNQCSRLQATCLIMFALDALIDLFAVD